MNRDDFFGSPVNLAKKTPGSASKRSIICFKGVARLDYRGKSATLAMALKS
jgi:hypothetical protein